MHKLENIPLQLIWLDRTVYISIARLQHSDGSASLVEPVQHSSHTQTGVGGCKGSIRNPRVWPVWQDCNSCGD